MYSRILWPRYSLFCAHLRRSSIAICCVSEEIWNECRWRWFYQLVSWFSLSFVRATQNQYGQIWPNLESQFSEKIFSIWQSIQSILDNFYAYRHTFLFINGQTYIQKIIWPSGHTAQSPIIFVSTLSQQTSKGGKEQHVDLTSVDWVTLPQVTSTSCHCNLISKYLVISATSLKRKQHSQKEWWRIFWTYSQRSTLAEEGREMEYTECFSFIETYGL